MNKTVNINLAGIFFHIDEDAYAKLQRYLDAVKHSFSNTQGQEEIIADIEARIAELFTEKIANQRQVIGIKEVEEVITIMGQPEDYMLDEEIFEDEPVHKKAKITSKQLYRDPEHGYIGGVSAGLSHYLGIETIWVRVLWVLLTLLSSGGFILIYIAFWIFVPEAKTTADKLAMRGEEVTISNIERKIREGFQDVSESVKSVDYKKYGQRATDGANSAATTLANALTFFLKLIVKFIGLIILLISGATLICLFIGLFAVGTFGIVDAPWTDYINMINSAAPLWLISLLAFFAIGIPFFFLFVLGLKILVSNLKSIGRIWSMTLLGLWILSMIGLAIIGINQATQTAYDGEVLVNEVLPVTASDTLYIRMRHNPEYTGKTWRSSDFRIAADDDNNRLIVGNDVRLIVKSTNDSVGRIEVLKSSEGRNYEEARSKAKNVKYETNFAGNELLLNSYFTTEAKHKYREQEVQVTVYLPEGLTLFADENISSFQRNTDRYGNILNSGMEEHFLTISDDEAICEDCPEESFDESFDNSEQWENDDMSEPEDDWDSSDDFDGNIDDEAERAQYNPKDSINRAGTPTMNRALRDSSNVDSIN